MKILKYIIPIAAALLLASCGEKEDPTNETPTPAKDPVDPELVVEGIPSGAVEAGSSFTLKLSSKSEGEISVRVSQPAIAGLQSVGDKEYNVSVMSFQDTKVAVSISQAAKGDYLAATKDFTVQIKGMGAVSIPGPDDEVSGTPFTYVESATSPLNPERGLYCAHEVHDDKTSLSAADVKARRATGHSVWLLEFYLTNYMSGNISSSYLKNIQNHFDAIREGGAKAIVRFAYQDHYTAGEEMDPEVEVVMKHVQQLERILKKNEDVLFVLQAGFVGAWGEWYYTSHFNSNPKSASDYKPRKELVEALLNVVPASRQIELRTPTFKMKMFGLALKDTLTATTAHDGSASSRLAGHNDCFGADANDRGTFDNDDTREYWKKETRYTIMGGETCDVSDYCLCPQTIKDLQDYHWTYLHDGYNQNVLSRWKSDGCFSEIERDLGYRLVLKDIHYEAVEAGKPCKLTLRLFNKGYAAPMNPREAWLVWVGSDGKTVKSPLGVDPRTWHTGYNGIVTYFTPSTSTGNLYLELSDPLLPDNPLYSIALANDNVFESKTGRNKLFEVK